MKTTNNTTYTLDQVLNACKDLSIEQIWALANFLADICGWDTSDYEPEKVPSKEYACTDLLQMINELGFPEYCIPVSKGTMVFVLKGRMSTENQNTVSVHKKSTHTFRELQISPFNDSVVKGDIGMGEMFTMNTNNLNYPENAREIVRRVNMYDELVKALVDIKILYMAHPHPINEFLEPYKEALKNIEQLIKQAEQI